MNKLIAFFKYNGKTFYITKSKDKIFFSKGEYSSNDVSNLSDEEYQIVKSIYDKLLIKEENSIFVKNMLVNNNEYSIYYDRKSTNYFWYPKTGIYNSCDNQYLNFQYNHQSSIVYNKKYYDKLKSPEYYQRLEKIEQNLVLVLVSASLCGTLMSGHVQRNIEQSQINTTSIIYSQNTESIKTQREYNYEDIRKVIEENQNIGEEEKDFLYKLKFIFDENHQYMDINCVIEKLKTLEIKYETIDVASGEYETNGLYNIRTNKITYGTKNFKSTSKSTFIHEFLHVLQDTSPNFMLELSNEFFTRETIMRLYKDGLILPEELISEDTQSRIEFLGLSKPETEEDWLYLISKDEGFGDGYSSYLGPYYVLASILPEDVLRNYQFNTKNIDLLTTSLAELDKNAINEDDAYERAYDLIDCINNFRIYNQENNEFEYAWDLKDCFKKIDYYYYQVKGISVYDDLDLAPILSNMFHHRNPSTRNEKLWNHQSYIESIYGNTGIILPKTYLSDSQENLILLYYDKNDNNNLKMIEISASIIDGYKNFMSTLEKDVNKPISKSLKILH